MHSPLRVFFELVLGIHKWYEMLIYLFSIYDKYMYDNDM